MTDSDKIRIFFQKMAAGAHFENTAELLHKKNNRLPRTAFRVMEASVEVIAESAFGVGMPPLAGV